MKKVTIKSLSLRNFRGEKDRITIFKDDETTIMGENGLGKSRHFDAFVWLLFGKDTKDRKDFNVKTIVDGKTLEKIDTEVSAVLNVDGEKINIRRVYAEKWVKPRGQVEERFSGHEHELYWNDVPLKVGEYNGRINSIINDTVFKMITNPLFFANMKWQDQREQLFHLAGTVTDEEIAALKPEYAELMDKITGKSLSDFKREISARKKKLKDELEKVQPRIDQTHKLMPENTDFNALEIEIKSLEDQVNKVDAAIHDKTKAIRMQYESAQDKQREINSLKQRQQKVLHDAKMEAKEKTLLDNESRRKLESDIKVINSEIYSQQRSLRGLQGEADAIQRRIDEKEAEIVKRRNDWHAENANEYCGDDVCHSCNQQLPEEQRENARSLFNQNKQEKLSKITQLGSSIQSELNKLKDSLADVNKDIQHTNTSIEVEQGNLDKVSQELSSIPLVEESEFNANELPEYIELSSKIQELENTIDNGSEEIDTTELQNRKKEIISKIDLAKSELQSRELIKKYKSEIQDLEAKGKHLAQQIADVEREEYVIQNLTKSKIDECERRINGLFTIVTFQLFEYTIDGNESETCVPLVNGVPFGAANTAGQVNAGLDIINALVRYHGVSAPIFIDGRESVNQIIPSESQIINLVVSHDKQLVIN